MCGIWASTGLAVSRQAIDLAAHRGPDGDRWLEFDADRRSIRLGHRRLAISGAADALQLVGAPSGRAWLTYNGELYRCGRLRRRLQSAGVAPGESDTATLLAMVSAFGVESLKDLEGMFAFVYYNRTTGDLLAVRDRFGIKPLYMLRLGQGVAFASEIKQFEGIDGFRARLDRRRAADFLRWGVTDHTPDTMWAGVSSVSPGHYVIVRSTGDGGVAVSESRWYEPPEFAPGGDIDAAYLDFDRRLRDAVDFHAATAVPAAVSLSGGLDSSAIAMLTPEALRCYSLTHEDPAIDESSYARAVASRRGASWTPVRLADEDLPGAVDAVVWQLDEPFPSLSVVAQWAVFQAASWDGVRVVLTGQGADELLGGYPFLHGPHLWGLLRAGKLSTFFGEARRDAPLARTFRAMGTALSPPFLLAAMVQRGLADPALARARFAASVCGRDDGAARGLDGFRRRLLGPGNLAMLLRYEDRTSMAHGIEARPPFLDREVVESALRIDATMLMRDGVTKLPLRRAVTGLLPEAVADRRDKLGFPTPEARWIRGPLRTFVRKHAREARERFPSVVRAEDVAIVDSQLDDPRPLMAPIWRVASLGAWAQRFHVEP